MISKTSDPCFREITLRHNSKLALSEHMSQVNSNLVNILFCLIQKSLCTIEQKKIKDQTKTCQNVSFCTCPSDCICQRIGTFAFSRSTKTNARLINNTSNQGHSREKV